MTNYNTGYYNRSYETPGSFYNNVNHRNYSSSDNDINTFRFNADIDESYRYEKLFSDNITFNNLFSSPVYFENPYPVYQGGGGFLSNGSGGTNWLGLAGIAAGVAVAIKLFGGGKGLGSLFGKKNKTAGQQLQQPQTPAATTPAAKSGEGKEIPSKAFLTWVNDNSAEFKTYYSNKDTKDKQVSKDELIALMGEYNQTHSDNQIDRPDELAEAMLAKLKKDDNAKISWKEFKRILSLKDINVDLIHILNNMDANQKEAFLDEYKNDKESISRVGFRQAVRDMKATGDLDAAVSDDRRKYQSDLKKIEKLSGDTGKLEESDLEILNGLFPEMN